MRIARASLVAVTLLALACCTPATPELKPFERQAGIAALEGWRAAGLPEPNKNRCDVTHWSVRLDSAKDFELDCMGATPKSAAGCTNYGSDGSWFRSPTYPVVVISPEWRSEPGIIIHELMHAFWLCSDMPNQLGSGNIDHLDPRVWQAHGGDTSAQGRALGVLKTLTPAPP